LSGFDRDDLIRTSNIAPDRVRDFALIDGDGDGYLTRIIEKPSDPSELARHAALQHPIISMNLWRFDARIFAACRDVPRSRRGEFELPEAVALAASRGVRFRIVPAPGPVLDLSTRADAADVARRLEGQVPRP
jgi:glucose-1-phosphate thymidylyltransferase